MAILITQGTQTSVYTKTNAGTDVQVVKIDVGSGTNLADFGGTISRVTDLLKGTVTNLVSGTINALASGTISAGTVQPYGLRHADAFATIVSNSGTVLGTVKAGVAGSAHYITDMLISAQGACTAVVYAGSTLVRGGTYYFGANGGLINNLNTPITIDAGSAITFSTVGTGLVTLEIRGYID